MTKISEYTYWSGQPITPGEHKLICVPQSVADGWQGFCSCGEWSGFLSFMMFRDRESLLAELKRLHEEHKAGVKIED